MFARLRDLDERAEVPGDEEAARMRMAATIQELWGSDEVRAATGWPLRVADVVSITEPPTAVELDALRTLQSA